ncbi:hypothetical protein ACWDZ6_21400 [Streptomyces sp. NPDC002926]
MCARSSGSIVQPSSSSGGLAFPDGRTAEHVKAAVLIASVLAALLTAALLRRRNTIYRRLYEAENLDADADGIPDIHQQMPGAALLGGQGV